MKWALLIGGLLGLVALTVAGVSGWLRWRKRALRDAGARIGLNALAEGESLVVPLVPLIDRPRRQYAVILSGCAHGREAAFFDLYVGSGDDWDLQSTVLLRHPEVAMPGFQLRRPRWTMIRQRTRGARVELPGREQDMKGLKLTSDAPDWARHVFSRAPRSFLERVREGRWSVEGLGHVLVLYQWGVRIPPRRLESFVREAAELAEETFALCGGAGR